MPNLTQYEEAMPKGAMARSTITERLKNEKERLEQRLEQVNSVIKELEKVPEVQKVLDAIARIGF